MVDGDGHDERFGRLYEAHRAAVAAYCRRRLPGDGADDVMAEVFLVAWRRIDDIPIGSELPWLYGVAARVVANQRRSIVRRSRLAGRVVSQRLNPSPETSSTVEVGDESVVETLATLSEADQELLRLRAWEQLSSAEIAVALGIRASAVDMRLSRARRRFERALIAAEFRASGSGARVARKGVS